MTIKHLFFAILVISFVSCGKINLHTPTHIETQRLKHGLFPMTSNYRLTSIEKGYLPYSAFCPLRREWDIMLTFPCIDDYSAQIDSSINYYQIKYQAPLPYLHKWIYYKDSSGVIVLLQEVDIIEKNINERSDMQIHHLYDIIQDTNYYYTFTLASRKCTEMVEQTKREMHRSARIYNSYLCGTAVEKSIRRTFPELSTKYQTIDSTTYKHLLQATPFAPPH